MKLLAFRLSAPFAAVFCVAAFFVAQPGTRAFSHLLVSTFSLTLAVSDTFFPTARRSAVALFWSSADFGSVFGYSFRERRRVGLGCGKPWSTGFIRISN